MQVWSKKFTGWKRALTHNICVQHTPYSVLGPELLELCHDDVNNVAMEEKHTTIKE